MKKNKTSKKKYIYKTTIIVTRNSIDLYTFLFFICIFRGSIVLFGNPDIVAARNHPVSSVVHYRSVRLGKGKRGGEREQGNSMVRWGKE